MRAEQAAYLLAEIAAAYPAMHLPIAAASTWRSWLQALPYDVARFAVLKVCASEKWPTVEALIGACGIESEQAKALLIGAKEGGYELVRAPEAPLGWATNRPALAAPEERHGPPVPMPPELRERIRAGIKRVSAKVGTEKNAGGKP